MDTATRPGIADLVHHGVKGMHWGHHLSKTLEFHTRVASGSASNLDKLRARALMSAIDVVKHKGSIEKFSQEQMADLQKRKLAFENGTETKAQKAARLASWSLADFFKARGNKELMKHDDDDSDFIADFLEHHGVKGQKWGVRHDPGHEGERAKSKVIRKADNNFEKSFQGAAGWVKIQNEFARHINPKLDHMNNTPQFKGKNMWDDPKLHEQYMKKYDKLVDDAAKLTSESLGMNASGTKQVKVTRSGTGLDAHWVAELVDIQHADMSTGSFNIIPKFDANGFVLSFSIEPDAMTQGEIAISDFLEHFGIKGMHWGQHKAGSKATSNGSEAEDRALAANIVRVGKALAKKHGPDIQTARAGFTKPGPTKQTHNAQIARAGGLHNISDKDLKSMLSRLDMEKKYTAILHEDRQKRIDGGKAALRILGEVGKIALPVLLGAVAANAASGGFRGGAPFKVPVVNPKIIEGVTRTLSRFPQGK